MDLSFFEFIGDGIGNDDIVNDVGNILQKKYNTKFVPTRIGNRYGQDENSIVTIYCHPEGEDTFIFSTKYNLETKECNDDFLYRRVCFELEKELSNLLSKRNVDAIIRVEMINKNSLDENIGLKEFLLKYPQITFMAYIVLNGKYGDVFVLDLYKELLNKYNLAGFSAFVFCAEQEEYVKAQTEIFDLEFFSKNMLKKYLKNEPAIYRAQDRMIVRVK